MSKAGRARSRALREIREKRETAAAEASAALAERAKGAGVTQGELRELMGTVQRRDADAEEKLRDALNQAFVSGGEAAIREHAGTIAQEMHGRMVAALSEAKLAGFLEGAVLTMAEAIRRVEGVAPAFLAKTEAVGILTQLRDERAKALEETFRLDDGCVGEHAPGSNPACEMRPQEGSDADQ